MQSAFMSLMKNGLFVLYALHVPKGCLSRSNRTVTRFSKKGRDIEIGMRDASSKASVQKGLLEQSDEE